MIDLAHPDEIEIRRLSAASRTEVEDIRTELERRGFAVMVRESGAGDVPELYHADIYAEKRVIPTGAELAARRAAQAQTQKALSRQYRWLWIGLGIGLFLVSLLLAYLLSPLIWAILKLG